jgi:hypothetical protein
MISKQSYLYVIFIVELIIWLVVLLFCNLRSWGAVSYYTSTQQDGHYRCQSITILFGDGKEGGPTAPDEFYGGALFVNGKKKLLMYSHFNGVYVEDGECSSS